MKGLILGLALLASTSAFAEDKCDLILIASETVMDARQRGVLLEDIVKAVDGNELYLALIKHAWSYPKYIMQANKDEAVKEFKEKYYLACIK